MPPSTASSGTLAREQPEPLLFDRASGQLTGASPLVRAAVAALRAGSAATKPVGHRGYGIGCRVVGSIMVPRELLVRLNEDALFDMPFCDAYWSRLLNCSYHYEQEIEALLRAARHDRYTFVDCGANFGYWSILASSRAFGVQQAIAIEASGPNLEQLKRNAELNGNRFHCLHAALAGRSGDFVRIHGARHEKLATVPLARSEPGCVETVSLDGLVEAGLIDASVPVVVKLDVEGVEIEALRGGGGLLAGDCVVICEEHGSDKTHAVSRYLAEQTSLRRFIFDEDNGVFMQLDQLEGLARMKKHAWVGYNVFATSSEHWSERLLSARWPFK